MLIEAALVLAAIVALLPWFTTLAAQESGRDGRFADAAISAPADPLAASAPTADAAAAVVAVKNEATRALFRTAGIQWAGWALAGLLLLGLSRRPSVAGRAETRSDKASARPARRNRRCWKSR